MRKSELEASAITYLTDSIRSRIPAYAGGRLNGPPPSGSRTENLQSDAGSLGRQVDAILSRSIPALPQFNRQRLGTLRLISDAGIIGTSDLATINNAAKVDEVIRTIDSMKPRFANPVQAATIGHLSEYLQRHGQIPHWVSPVEFPETAVVGHRADLRLPEKHTSVYTSGNIKHRDRYNADLREINKLLDTIIPDGASYNEVRQRVIDEIVTHSSSIQNWLKRQRTIAETRGAETRDFIPNQFHYRMKEVTDAVEKIIHPERQKLLQLADNKNVRKLAPDEVKDIARLIAQYRFSSDSSYAANGATEAAHRPISYQPHPYLAYHMLAAVLYDNPHRARTNPIAAEMAGHVAKSLDAVIPPSRGNFYSRICFLKTVSDNRDFWLAPGMVDINDRPELAAFVGSGQLHTLKTNSPDQFNDLVRDLHDFHEAWTCRLLTVPQRHLVVAGASKADKSTGLKKPQISAVRRGIERAGCAAGQTKLTFKPTGTKSLANDKRRSDARRSSISDPSPFFRHETGQRNRATGSDLSNIRETPRDALSKRKRDDSIER
ncbi:hypothetical protein LAV84_30730 [Rhizobium sp. VS19-DR104.2]|uniref:hypothetical protein n=1 Tax=unclassified Rhizobium TaxID=2613769 RepID=UPI001C5B86B1|nr:MULTISPECIES: hypothetical protein [unclassified Rhizobium]MBZ5763833.1 hypothetical protein [Rhizobium sp. VS19-DR96]MBZ5769768.1 hypothetical protein [Rhizobium sp. VS19-DR129.2]MBZ5777311.1 hypothetical protein [Rhizobium sp. VS19-DRK62.2]MBZ5788429.1 hypothetical protein [Rhizobium sp. VS19-DR121]MBZ5805876.1 hypothetical protein [Rhizobium sp. VS19-DR181]